MRQRDAVGAMAAVVDDEFFPDRFDKRSFAHELSDGKFTDWQHERGPEQRELALEPRRTFENLVRRRHAIPAFRTLAWKTPTHRSEINPVAGFLFRPPQG